MKVVACLIEEWDDGDFIGKCLVDGADDHPHGLVKESDLD